MSGDSKAAGDNLDTMKHVLDGVQEQIRFADTKAGFVVAFQTFLFGIIASQADSLASINSDNHPNLFGIRIGLIVIYMLTCVISMIYAIRAVIPQFGEQAPMCKIFFGHIVKQYQRDYQKYAADAAGATDAEWFRDYATQIVENSNIANEKHRKARVAARWSIAVVAFAIMLIGSGILARQSSVATTVTPPTPSSPSTPDR